MARLIIALLLVAACVVGLGFYLGWFHFTSDRGDDKDHATVTVDEEKIREDKKKAEEKLQELEHKKDKATAPAEKGKDPGAPPAQPPQDPE